MTWCFYLTTDSTTVKYCKPCKGLATSVLVYYLLKANSFLSTMKVDKHFVSDEAQHRKPK